MKRSARAAATIRRAEADAQSWPGKRLYLGSASSPASHGSASAIWTWSAGGKTCGLLAAGSKGGCSGGTVCNAAGGCGSLLTGLLLTKGGEVMVNPGAVFRVKFVKPLTVPAVQQPGSRPRPIDQTDDNKPPTKNN